MPEQTLETDYDLRSIGLNEISNLLKNGDTDISEGILFFSKAQGIYNSVFYSMGNSSGQPDVLAIQPQRSLLFSLLDAAKYAEASLSKGRKLMIVPLDNLALIEIKQHLASEPLKVNGLEVQCRETPLITDDSLTLDLRKNGPVFVGRCAFNPVENAKRAKELVEMRAYFTEVFSGPKYS